jgi:hypothetical protein
MMGMPITVLTGLGAVILAAVTLAPVAVVEDVTGNPSGVEFMDYVEPGKVIRLGPADSIVLGYLNSCWREKITGGTVTVGAQLSEVQAGKVEREKVPCEARKMLLNAEVANKSGAMVFRQLPRGQQTAPLRPQFTLYGLSPVIEVKAGGSLVVERLDKPGERHEMVISTQQLLRGAFIDFAKAGIALAPRGVYRAEAGAQQVVFDIAPGAGPGQTPLAGRLLRLHLAH